MKKSLTLVTRCTGNITKLMAAIVFSSGVNAVAAEEDDTSVNVYYKNNVTNVVANGGSFHLKPELRIQTRYSTPFDGNPRTLDGLNEDTGNLQVKRARIKLGGKITDDLDMKFEYDAEGSRLLDARITKKFYDEFQFRFGRMKAHYSPERVSSSKDQQLVDRSVVNDFFNVDRQQGVTVMGRLNKGSMWDTSYWFDIFNGTGRDQGNENNHYMYVGRYQWNFLGEQIETAMGDLKYRDKPVMHVAVSASTNISAYTRFATGGAGQLPEFVDKAVVGEDSQFKLTQWMFDTIYKYKGISFQFEYHEKEVEDRVNNEVTDMKGFYVQSGFFPKAFSDKFPEQLELAARYSVVNPNTNVKGNHLREYIVGANWFTTGHRNKITVDLGHYEIDHGIGETASDVRFRIQHDLSF